mgnify:CR=1 FL=1
MNLKKFSLRELKQLESEIYEEILSRMKKDEEIIYMDLDEYSLPQLEQLRRRVESKIDFLMLKYNGSRIYRCRK